MRIGAKIYYELSSGNIIVNTGERSGDVVETTQEQDYSAFKALSERAPATVGMIQLEYGAYRADYEEGGIITRIDLETMRPLFTYPDPTEPETPQEPQPPLTEQLTSLKTENESLKSRVSDVEMTITEILFS